MLMMSFTRAALRTPRFDTNENLVGDMLDLVQEHELDWQALEFEAPEQRAKDSEKYWLLRNSPMHFQEGTATVPGLESRNKLAFHKFPNSDGSPSNARAEVQPATNKADRHDKKPCHAHCLLKHRARLAWLTTAGPEISDLSVWEDKHVSVRDLARKIRKVIEGAADILFSDKKLPRDWTDKKSLLRWDLEVTIPKDGVLRQDTSGLVPIFIRKDPESNGWKVDLSDMEACLGLWAFSLKGKYLQDGREKTTKFRRVVAVSTDDGSLPTDLSIWIEDMRTKTQKAKLQGKKDDPPFFGQKSISAETKDVLTVPADKSLVVCCAQDIFMNSLSAASMITGGLGGETVPKRGPKGFCLVDETLSKLIQLFHENGLGSEKTHPRVLSPSSALCRNYHQ
jgi:hypothetical protein